jgi:hypothetical protein
VSQKRCKITINILNASYYNVEINDNKTVNRSIYDVLYFRICSVYEVVYKEKGGIL